MVKEKFDWEKLNNIVLKVEKIELEKVFDVFTKKKNTKKEEEEEDKTIDSVEKFEI
jgi:type IV secretion system protein VirD4